MISKKKMNPRFETIGRLRFRLEAQFEIELHYPVVNGIRVDRFSRLKGTQMSERVLSEYRYEKLTWPEINDAVELGQVCIVPCGAIEQHGPHLPLDVDVLCSTQIAVGAGKRVPDKILVLPSVNYGYTGHVMDFPGTINNDFEHFMHHVLDVTRSLAYHGFKKIILLNGHGSNMPNLDLVAPADQPRNGCRMHPRSLVEPPHRGQKLSA